MAASSIDWSILRDQKELEQFSLTDARELTSDYGLLNFERVEVAPGVVANIAEIESRKAFKLSTNLETQGDRICLQTTVVGQCGLDVEDGVNTIYRTGASVAHAVRGTSATFRFPAKSRLKTINFTFSRDAFDDLLTGDVPNEVRALLRDSPTPLDQARIRTPFPLQLLADIVFHENLTGSLRKLQIEGMGRILMAQFLATLSQTLEGETDARVSRTLKDQLYDIRDRIIADPTDLPGLDALAKDTGVDHKRLNAGFRTLFGVTIFEFSRNHRLDCARARLLNDKAAIKEIAHDAGYAHVSNFVTAYRRRFGITPGGEKANKPIAYNPQNLRLPDR